MYNTSLLFLGRAKTETKSLARRSTRRDDQSWIDRGEGTQRGPFISIWRNAKHLPIENSRKKTVARRTGIADPHRRNSTLTLAKSLARANIEKTNNRPHRRDYSASSIRDDWPARSASRDRAGFAFDFDRTGQPSGVSHGRAWTHTGRALDEEEGEEERSIGLVSRPGRAAWIKRSAHHDPHRGDLKEEEARL